MPIDLKYLLKCPDCGGKIGHDLVCSQCFRIYQQRDAIVNLMPKDQALPNLAVYSDPDYIKYNSLQGQTDDYFYRNRNPLINWVQCSGYNAIKKLLCEHSGAILECGCGTGIFIDIHKQINKSNYVMSDIDDRSLARIKDRESLAGVVKATAYRLPFVDASFDVVISHAQLEHLPYLDHALQEIKRVLKPAGTFLASVPNEGGLFWSKGRQMTSALYFKNTYGIDYLKANRIDHFNTVHQIDRALRRYFDIEKRIFFPFMFPNFDFNFTCTYKLRSNKPLSN